MFVCWCVGMKTALLDTGVLATPSKIPETRSCNADATQIWLNLCISFWR